MEAPSGSPEDGSPLWLPRGGVAERAGWYVKKYAKNMVRCCRLKV